MKTFFTELFDYNRTMNSELIKAMVEQQDMVTDKSLELMNHILNAHQRWNTRVKKDQEMVGTWDLNALDELISINENNYQATLSIIGSFAFETIIEYPGAEDNVHKNSVRDMLFHIINHSTYHRGQIAMDFRQSGLKPLETDYDAWRDCLT
jgi:uncharacterized damage-inducible protein DinB